MCEELRTFTFESGYAASDTFRALHILELPGKRNCAGSAKKKSELKKQVSISHSREN